MVAGPENAHDAIVMNPTGTPAPTPTDYEGVPIYATNGLVNTEVAS